MCPVNKQRKWLKTDREVRTKLIKLQSNEPMVSTAVTLLEYSVCFYCW